MTDTLYKEFTDYIDDILFKNDISEFKNNPQVLQMLDHVIPVHAIFYLEVINEKFNISNDDIYSFCKINDSIGNPIKYKLIDNNPISLTSIRYICHSLLILEYIKKLDIKNVKLVEVGCGYGGLMLALHFFQSKYDINIEKYYMVDLKQPNKLQEKYFNSICELYPNTFNKNTMNIEFIESTNYGSEINEDNLFFISNYCFSEIHDIHQKGYIKNLLPKCQHGFLCWNNIDIYNFSKDITYELEYPLTGDKNKYVYF